MGDEDLSYKMTDSGVGSSLLDGSGGGVAAKLMAQMGYQKGTGLGMAR